MQVPTKWTDLQAQTRLQIERGLPELADQLPLLKLSDMYKLLRKTSDAARTSKGPSHRDTTAPLMALGLLQSDTREPAAVETWRELLAVLHLEPASLNPGLELSVTHNLSRELMLIGRFAEAEHFAKRACPQLVERFGVNSPQALGSRRFIIEAVGCQHKTAEAKQILEEGFVVVEGMKGGRWAEHQQDELEAMEEVKMKLAELMLA